MCGRYCVLTDEDADEMNRIIAEINRRQVAGQPVVTGEIRPTDVAPVVEAGGPVAMRWGFLFPWNKTLGINARRETVLEKPFFARPFRRSRVVVPTCGFFEWLHEGKAVRDKYLFRLPGETMLYLAGLCDTFPLPSGAFERRYTIVTAPANRVMLAYHDRMPVCLRRSELTAWLSDERAALELMNRDQPELAASLDGPPAPRQLSMF